MGSQDAVAQPEGTRSYIGISLAISALLIFTVGGGLLWKFQQQQQEIKERDAYAGAIEKLWKQNGIILEDSRRFLEEQPDLAEGKKLLKSHEAFFRSMKQVLEKPEAQAALSMPDGNQNDMGEFKVRLDEWAALHASPWAKVEKGTATAASLYTAFRRWELARNALWKKLAAYVKLSAPPAPSIALLQPLNSRAKELLSRAEPDHYSRSQWADLAELLERQNCPMDAEFQRWLKLWEDLDGPSPSAAAEMNFADASLPEWLHEKAQKQHDKDMAAASQVADKNKKDSANQPTENSKPKVMAEDADALPLSHDIHVLLLKPGEDPSAMVTELKVAADMQLYVGEAWDAHPSPDGKAEPRDGELKPWHSVSIESSNEINFGPSRLAPLNEMVRISNSGALVALPKQLRSPAHGLRLVARSKDGMQVLFDLRVLPLHSVVARPLFTTELPAAADNFATATLRLPAGFIPRLHLLSLTRPAYALRLDGTASEQKIYELKHTVDSSFEVIAPASYSAHSQSIQTLGLQIAELEAGIQKDAAELANIDPRMLALVREQKKLALTLGITEKQERLQALRDQLKALAAQPAVHFDLLPGRYTLLIEHAGSKIELCKLNVSASPKITTTTTKPTAP